MAQQQILGEFAYRRATRITVAAHRQEELVLGTGQARRLSLFLTPPLEPTQAGPKTQEPGVVLIGDARQPPSLATDI
jgi:hypothetical protein